ncbi:MAG: DUF937 domain-containing protein [Mastigocoleus sp. MO_167.B18]|nr:DUF937 domain-containing protein [Mastigocoleus sp. MO_167.B18]
MGLFDQIISAVGNPETQGSIEQIGNIMNTVQQLSGNAGADQSTMQSAMSVVGSFVRSSLQEKRSAEGDEAVQSLVSEHAGTSPSLQAVSSIFSPQMQQQVAEAVSQRTGLDMSAIQGMLPVLVPMVLNLLKTGASSQNPQQNSNPVLNSFLDADGDGDVDVADMMQMASRYMGGQ